MYYTYVLKSEKDGLLYVGFSEDLRQRLIDHNSGSVQTTKSHRPWRLVYYEACLIRLDALKREKALKTGFGRAYLKRRLSAL